MDSGYITSPPIASGCDESHTATGGLPAVPNVIGVRLGRLGDLERAEEPDESCCDEGRITAAVEDIADYRNRYAALMHHVTGGTAHVPGAGRQPRETVETILRTLGARYGDEDWHSHVVRLDVDSVGLVLELDEGDAAEGRGHVVGSPLPAAVGCIVGRSRVPGGENSPAPAAGAGCGSRKREAVTMCERRGECASAAQHLLRVAVPADAILLATCLHRGR